MAYMLIITYVKLEKYMEMLRQRGTDRRVTQKHQLAGLEISEMLGDKEHKSLYIKLAKEKGVSQMLSLAKDVANRKNIKNKGAYFMKIVFSKENE